MGFLATYKKVLAVTVGTLCLFIALYAPAMSLLILTEKEIEWGIMNWIFLVIGMIFLWGSIVTLARSIGLGVGNLINKKTK